MKHHHIAFLLMPAILSLLFLPATGRSQEEIRQTDVGNIIRFLSSDLMKGRASFTPENVAAGGFIAEAFRKAGLVPMGGEDGFVIEYPVRRLRPEMKSAVINGVAIGASNVIVSSTFPSLDWTEADSVDVLRMGESFDRSLFRDTKRGIVLVPEAHAALFGRYRSYFEGPTIDPGGREEKALVAVLTDITDPVSFRVTYRAAVDTPVVRNIVGTIPGTRSGQSIIFSAHYDHIGIREAVNGDSIANGANDDASGVTGVIALAAYFSSGTRPERTLVFAAFDGEEMGGLGSRRLAARIDPDTVVAMINMEMIGSPSKFGPETFWITGYERSTLGQIIADELKGSPYRVFPDPYPAQNLFFRSDNASFARLGIPAHSFSTHMMDADSIYHTVKDDLDHLDIGVLTATIRGIARGVRGLVEGRETPSRISPQE